MKKKYEQIPNPVANLENIDWFTNNQKLIYFCKYYINVLSLDYIILFNKQ